MISSEVKPRSPYPVHHLAWSFSFPLTQPILETYNRWASQYNQLLSGFEFVDDYY